METYQVANGPAVRETELILQAQRGERDAFGELVCLHSRGVLNVIYRMCGDLQIAEDAAQDAFIRAWLRLSSYRPQTSFRSWLYRIAVNAAIDMLRRDRRVVPGALEEMPLHDPLPGPEATLTREERTAAVQKAVLSLPRASRAVLVLKEYEGMSYREIAEALDIPLGTVMSRLSYARKVLKAALEGQVSAERMEADYVQAYE